MQRAALPWVASVLALTACGEPFSNEPLRVDVAKDKELAAAIPEQDDFALTAPAESDEAHPRRSCAGGGASKAACRSFRFAAGVSRLTRSLLKPIKQLAGVKPTVRTSDGRLWGPSQAPAGHWQRVEVRKLVGEDAEFSWAIEVAAAKEGPWQGLVVGAPASITYDGDVAREILGRDHAGVLRITTDGKGCNRALILRLDGFQGEAAAGRPGSGQDPSEGEFRFRRECDGSGQMDWGFLSDHPRRDCRVSTSMVVRWNARGAGRADPRFVGHECWDADFQVVSDGDCVYAEAVEPEDITVPPGTCL